MSDTTDEASATDVLRAILECAYSWKGAARIIGNIRAQDISRACRVALDDRARIAELEAELGRARYTITELDLDAKSGRDRIAELEATLTQE